jgi:PKD repeat protein
MKRTAMFFVLALLVLMPCTAMASAPQVSNNGSTCTDVKITSFYVHPSTSTVPAKVGFTTYVSGPVKLVRYTVMNSTTGKAVASCNSYCSHCTKKGICTCSVIIKQAGTFDVKLTAYGPKNCHVEQVKKAAVTVAPAKATTKLTAGFKSAVSGKKVTFTDTSSGAAKYMWSFGDGSMSTLKNPTHTYKKAGTYRVCLTVCDAGHTSCKSVCNKVIVK